MSRPLDLLHGRGTLQVAVDFKSRRFLPRSFAMLDLSIGEIARRAHVATSTIRYYERIGLLPKPRRTGGRRRYDDSILERLAMVRFAKQVGFSVAEVRILLGGATGRPPPERWRKLAHDKLAQVDRLIADASAVRQLLLDTL